MFSIPPNLAKILDQDVPTIHSSVTSKLGHDVAEGSTTSSPVLQLSSSSLPPVTSATPSDLYASSTPTPSATVTPKTDPSSQDTLFFKLHMREDLVLKRIVVLPGIERSMASVCANTVANRDTEVVDVMPEYVLGGPSWAHFHDRACISVLQEQQDVERVYLSRCEVAAALASRLLDETTGSPPRSHVFDTHNNAQGDEEEEEDDIGEDYVLTTGLRHHPKIKPTAYAYTGIPEAFLGARHSDVHGLADTIDSQLSPFMGYKSIVPDALFATVEALKYATRAGIAHIWPRCNGASTPASIKDRTRFCGSAKCNGGHEATTAGRPSGFDTRLIEQILTHACRRGLPLSAIQHPERINDNLLAGIYDLLDDVCAYSTT